MRKQLSNRPWTRRASRCLALAGSLSLVGPAFALTVTETFGGPAPGTDAYWDKLNNKTGGQSYGWSGTNFVNGAANG